MKKLMSAEQSTGPRLGNNDMISRDAGGWVFVNSTFLLYHICKYE